MKWGLFMWVKKRAESASWKYVERAETNATFFPCTFPREYTMPWTVR